MSGGKKGKGGAARPEEPAEGWESLAEEASAGRLAPSPELEEALREAAAAVDEAEAESAAAARAGEDSPELQAELKDAQDRLLRLRADFENFRKRAQKEHQEAHQYGHQNLVKDLLPTVDNLERAITHARESGDGDLDGLLQGVELVHRELLAALQKHGVAAIEAVGQGFDPAFHEGMAQVPDGSVEPNTIVEELQKGYRLRDRLLRASRVIVARAPEPSPDERESEDEGEGGAE